MIRQIHKIHRIPATGFFKVIVLNVIEAFFLVSSILLMYPFIKYLTEGVDGVNALFQESQYKYFRVIFDTLNINISLLSLIILTTFPIIIGQVFRYFKNVKIVEMQQSIIYGLRKRFINRLFATNILKLKTIQVGELSNAVSMESMRVGVSLQYVLNLYSFLFISSIYIVMLFSIAPTLTVFTLFLLTIIPFITKRHNLLLKLLGKIVSQSNRNIQSFIIDKIRMLKKIHLSGTNDNEIKAFMRISKLFEDTYLKSGKTIAFVDAFLEPLAFIIALTVMYTGVEFLHMKFDTIILFLIILQRLSPSVKQIIQSKNQISSYGGSLDMYKSYLTMLNNNQMKNTGTKRFNTLKNNIKLKNINFGYNENILFENLNLTFEVKSTTALIGKSGSGKSTLADILIGFIHIERGQVLFDGVDINELDTSTLWQKLGYLTQETFLSFGTIRDNILYGLKNRSDEEIRGACRKAHIWEFIQTLKNGLDTQIGESAGKLSGGQKQRLQLAHLFLQDPEIIILDEPTSALDSESEKVIVESLKELRGKKTIIIIAHRLSTIQHADKIVVLDDGKVIEEGTHDDLIKYEGRYKKYFGNNEE